MPIKRPLTVDELNQLELKGYNTSNYNGEPVEFHDPPKQTSAKEAYARHAISGIIPALGSAAGFAAGASPILPWNAAAIAASPGTLGISLAVPLISGLVGGAISGGATAKVQDIVTPQSILDRNAIADTEYPLASKLGRYTSGMAAMRPSLATLQGAGSGIARLAANRVAGAERAVLQQSEREGIKAIAAGAGISAASSVGEQLVRKGEVDWKEVGESTLAGVTTMHKPTIAGRFVMHQGMADPNKPITQDPEALMRTIADIKPTKEDIAKVKEASDAKSNELKLANEVLKAKKLAEKEDAIKKKMAGLEPLKVKEKGTPIKEPIPKTETPTPPAAQPPPMEPTAPPIVASPATPVVAPRPVVEPVAPVVPVVAEVPAKATVPAQPVTTKAETPIVVKPVIDEITRQKLDTKGILPEIYNNATPEQIAKWLEPVPVITRPSVSSEAPIVPRPKIKPKAPKISKDEFYSAKRKEHQKAVDELEEAWYAVADGEDPTALKRIVKSYNGEGADIHQFEMNLKPGTNEFIDAVMKLRGDKSRPGKSKVKTPVIDKVVEPIETPEQRNARIAGELGVPDELNQENSNVQTPEGKRISDELATRKKAARPTTAWMSAAKEVDRNLPPVIEDATLPAKGQINLKTGQRTVNPTTQTLDTVHHETAHDLVRTIYEAKDKGSARATDYINKLEKAQQEGLDAYNKERVTKGLKPVDHEEFATSQQGNEFLLQQLNLNKETKWRRWVNDTKAMYNTAYKKNPTIADLRRVLNFRYVNEVVPRRIFEKGGVVTNGKENEKGKEGNEELLKTDKVEEPSVKEASPFKDTADRQAQFEAIKDKADAEEMVKKLDAEKKILKAAYDGDPSSDVGHKAVNSMTVNKMLTEVLEKEYGVKGDPSIKYQESNEGLPNTEPTPGTFQSKQKYGQDKDLELSIHAVKNGDKPITTFYKSVNKINNLPSDVEIKSITNKDAIAWVGDSAIIKKDNVKAFNNLMKAVHSNSVSKVGEALGYTKKEIEDFHVRAVEQQIKDRKEGNVRNQENKEGLPHTDRATDILPADPTRQSFFRKMSSSFDRVDEVSPLHAQAARDYENRKSGYVGLANAALVDLNKFKRDDINRVMAQHRDAYRNGNTVDLSGPNDAAISKILSDYYGKIADLRRELGIKVNHRTGGKDEFYVPDMMNAETADVFTRDPTGSKAMDLKRQWAEHIMEQEGESGRSLEDVLYDINKYIEALGGKHNNYISLEFGAIRKAAGYGLPESMRDPDAINTLARYSRRAAADLAFFQEIQSKPEIAGPLHVKDQNGDVPNEYRLSAFPQDKRIQNMMKWITNDIGNVQNNSPLLRSIVRLVNNALLGPATGVRDLVSVPMNALPYIHSFSDLGAAWKGIAMLRENSRAALESGARQPHIDKIALDDVLESPNRWANMVGIVADGLRKYQGREFMENIARDITFSVGKELGRNNIIGLKAGDKQSKLWLKKFGDLVEGDLTTLQGAELEKALNQIGKNFTDRNQGTYGGRGLPVGIVDSQFAPFLSLQKWSVEKSNVIYKDVVMPFMSGENRLPMLTYALGGMMTGAAIQQLNQLMSGKKGIDPTIAEAMDKGNGAAIVQELAVIMQLAALGGIISDGVKIAVDTSVRGRVPRNIVSFPTATATIRTAESVTDMAEALRQGEDPWKVVKAFVLDTMSNNIQAARMIANRTVNDEVSDRKDKFRDRRVFNELEGKPAGVIAKTNPYLGLDAKEFKQSKDIKEAAGMVKPLVQRAVEKSDGNREKLRASLSSLKGNSYQTMPSPKDSPTEFKTFYDFLVRTQGIDEANARVKDYVMQTHVNKAKSRMIH